VPAIWVGLSLRYWQGVLVTKQRLLLLLFNKVAAKRGEDVGTKIQVIPKVQLERGLHQDNEERRK